MKLSGLIKSITLLSITFLFINCGGGGGGGNGGNAGSNNNSGTGFKLPPVTKSTRSYPKLVNYFHRMDLSENNLPNREIYLAQWDVIILNPQNVKDQGLSLKKIRDANRNIKILAWIPFGQSSESFEMSKSMPNLYDYYIRDTKGNYVSPSWGGYLMNPWKNNFAWPKHVISYIKTNYSDAGYYDGFMFDCIWTIAPSWYSSSGVDIDENGTYNQTDDNEYQEGMSYLFQKLRDDLPEIIITGNGGTPWPANSPYYDNANGNMAENAFGDEFGSDNSTFLTQWAFYQTCISKITSRPMYYFLVADLRFGRTQEQAQKATELSDEDKRRFRLALTTTLLGDGYLGFDRGDCLHGQLWWFDEYNIDLGNPLAGYEAPNSYRTNVYGNGTYSREFSNGCVLVNPTVNVVTVSFPENRTDVSTGMTANTFNLAANDGRIFIRR